VNRLAQREKDQDGFEAYLRHLSDENEESLKKLRATWMDPLINDNFRYLLSEVASLEKKLQQAQADLLVNTFNPNSVTGKQLIAKCKRLQEENEALGRQLEAGKQELEQQNALLKDINEELQRGMAEMQELVQHLDAELLELTLANAKLKARLRHCRCQHVPAELLADDAHEQQQRQQQTEDASNTTPAGSHTDSSAGGPMPPSEPSSSSSRSANTPAPMADE